MPGRRPNDSDVVDVTKADKNQIVSKIRFLVFMTMMVMKALPFSVPFLWTATTSAFLTVRPSLYAGHIRNSNTIYSRSQSTTTTTTSTALFDSVGTEPTLMDAVSACVASALGSDRVVLKPTTGGGMTGGGGASTIAVIDEVLGRKYFIKFAPLATGGGRMLKAEYLGVKDMADTDTVRVPQPIAYGEGGPDNAAFVVFEFLEFGGTTKEFDLGQQLARMHRATSDNCCFGYQVDNTIGATHQPNPWTEDWADFWDKHRLGHMLKLTNNLGFSEEKVDKLREITRLYLSHKPQPSLVHGDLWGGNKSFVKVDGQVEAVIFDPATYYGDREVDVAMTSLFGGFGHHFYEGYEYEWELHPDYHRRKVIYNLYHILN